MTSLLLLLSTSLLAPHPQVAEPEPSRFEVEVPPTILARLEGLETLEDSRMIIDLLPAHGGYGGGAEEEAILRISAPVATWELGSESVTLDRLLGLLELRAPARSFPEDWNQLEGEFIAIPTLVMVDDRDVDPIMVRGEGSRVLRGKDRAEPVSLGLDDVLVETTSDPRPDPGVLEVELGSELLSNRGLPGGHRQEVTHRAYVVLPDGYHDLSAERRLWPVVYVITGTEEARTRAASIADLVEMPTTRRVLPQVIWVVLEKDTEHGHHFFVDSDLHGPRGRALVEEFIPWLDVRFRTIPDADARLLVGEQQGGHGVLNLLMEHPEVFSNAWAVSPDATSFGALGTIDLYRDRDAFRHEGGTSRPALRSALGSERELVHLDVEGEVMRARVLFGEGIPRSRWHELCATFGGLPGLDRRAWWPFDPSEGGIRPAQVDRWARHDLARRVAEDPRQAGLLQQRARIMVGDRDERYRDRGILVLADSVDRSAGTEARDWIKIVEGSGSLETGVIARMYVGEEVIRVLRDRGHHE
ncbi:MAG: alpha/beta hydrolase-fold protein [Planctomycetota bacterium]|nr:alpha/beta hydrolase-fold protein [Planctomycetota bacterium]